VRWARSASVTVPAAALFEQLFRVQVERVHSSPSISSSPGSASMRLRSASFARRTRLRTVFSGTWVAAATSGSENPQADPHREGLGMLERQLGHQLSHQCATAPGGEVFVLRGEADCTSSTSVSSRRSERKLTRRFVATTSRATMRAA